MNKTTESHQERAREYLSTKDKMMSNIDKVMSDPEKMAKASLSVKNNPNVARLAQVMSSEPDTMKRINAIPSSKRKQMVKQSRKSNAASREQPIKVVLMKLSGVARNQPYPKDKEETWTTVDIGNGIYCMFDMDDTVPNKKASKVAHMPIKGEAYFFRKEGEGVSDLSVDQFMSHCT